MVQLGHYACLSAGLILLYLATLLYPDEQNRLHNRLEDWWVKLAVTGDSLGAKASSLARAIAERVATFVEPIVPIRGIRGFYDLECAIRDVGGSGANRHHPSTTDARRNGNRNASRRIYPVSKISSSLGAMGGHVLCVVCSTAVWNSVSLRQFV